MAMDGVPEMQLGALSLNTAENVSRSSQQECSIEAQIASAQAKL